MSVGTEEPKPKSDDAAGRAPAAEQVRKRTVGVLAAFAAVLGFGPRKGKAEDLGALSADTGTRLAYERTDLANQRTDLALERSFLASERTLMAWLRTAISMISFGFTLGKLGDALKDVEVRGIFAGYRTVSISSLAYFLVVLGTVALLFATGQHVVRTHELVTLGYRPRFSLAIGVAVLMAVMGGGALTALVMEL